MSKGAFDRALQQHTGSIDLGKHGKHVTQNEIPNQHTNFNTTSPSDSSSDSTQQSQHISSGSSLGGVIWEDRKRWYGLTHILKIPITFTKYRLESDAIYVETGLFSKVEENIILYRILDISLKMKFTDRIFNMGDIVIKSADKTLPIFTLENVKNPRYVKQLIFNEVEKSRRNNKVIGREMVGSSGDLDFL